MSVNPGCLFQLGTEQELPAVYPGNKKRKKKSPDSGGSCSCVTHKSLISSHYSSYSYSLFFFTDFLNMTKMENNAEKMKKRAGLAFENKPNLLAV